MQVSCQKSHMSSHCRRFSTTIISWAAKLLIVKDSATVAEGRQAGRLTTPPNNKRQ